MAEPQSSLLFGPQMQPQSSVNLDANPLQWREGGVSRKELVLMAGAGRMREIISERGAVWNCEGVWYTLGKCTNLGWLQGRDDLETKLEW